MRDLIDSGERTTFSTGACREITEEKGRCDLIYNKAWGVLVDDVFYENIENFVRFGNMPDIYYCIDIISKKYYGGSYETLYLDLARHYANGAKKYSDRNMEKGLPFHSMIDSALRHYTKLKAGWSDEPHAVAVVWNLITLLYMMDYHPELNDLPYKDNKKDE